MGAIISLREVTKRFRETVALDKVTVDFEAGGKFWCGASGWARTWTSPRG